MLRVSFLNVKNVLNRCPFRCQPNFDPFRRPKNIKYSKFWREPLPPQSSVTLLQLERKKSHQARLNGIFNFKMSILQGLQVTFAEWGNRDARSESLLK